VLDRTQEVNERIESEEHAMEPSGKSLCGQN
jgi:hypothetical protein